MFEEVLKRQPDHAEAFACAVRIRELLCERDEELGKFRIVFLFGECLRPVERQVEVATTVVDAAKLALAEDYQPLSDMRASAEYRMQVAQNLLQRFWLESQGQRGINLESFVLAQEAARHVG